MNLCTDQLVLLLAERARIASISYLAFDPEVSHHAPLAQGLHANHGQAEEILPLRPDLILAGTYTTRATTTILRRFGHPVLTLDPASGFDAIRANIRRVAGALGEHAKAERIIADFNRRLAVIRARRAGNDHDQPRAIVLQPRGMTTGPGSLVDGILHAGGLRNLSADLGVTGIGFLPLERVIAARPDILVVAARPAGRPSLTHQALHHPAHVALSGADRIDLPASLWTCGGPQAIDAILRLARAADAWREGKPLP
jgi:iron complex transport system substrate-binding protein